MTKNYLKLIGIRIRQLRKAKKLTQEDLADKADLNPNYLGRIERGEINLTIDTLMKISEGLEANLGEIFVLEQSSSKQQLKDVKAKLKRFINKQGFDKLTVLSEIAALLERN